MNRNPYEKPSLHICPKECCFFWRKSGNSFAPKLYENIVDEIDMGEEKESKDINEPLAFGYWPIGNNKKYWECDLDNEKTVEMLFDYAQILEVNITCKGWNYLIKRYGFEKLFEIDKRSGWFDGDNIEEYISWVELQMSYK